MTCSRSRFGVLVGLLWLTGIVLARPAGTDSLPVLTSVAQVHQLSIADRQQGYPVRLRVVVTEYALLRFRGGLFPQFFVQDSSGGIAVAADRPSFQLHPGDLIELTGRTLHKDSAAYIAHPAVRLLGKAPLPAAVPATRPELWSGQRSGQRVEVSGTVLHLYQEDQWAALDVMLEGGAVECFLPDLASDPQIPDLQKLLGARIKIQGVASEALEEYGRPRIYAAGSGLAIERLEDKQRLASVLPIGRLGTARGARARVEGVVTYVRDKTLALQDQSGGVLATVRAGPVALAPGDRVEVVGFVPGNGAEPVLLYASLSKLSSNLPAAPLEVSAHDVLAKRLNARYVALEGRLLHAEVASERLHLTFQDGDDLFSAEMESLPPNKDQIFLPDSHWRVVGVALLEPDRWSGTRPAFRILLPSDYHLTRLRAPGWWTPARLLGLIGLAGLAVLAALAWSAVLRERLRRQTELIREQLKREADLEARYRNLFENASDVVASLDLTGRVLSVNAAGERVSGYPRQKLIGMHLEELLAPGLSWNVTGLLTGGEVPEPIEVDILRADGRPVTLEVSRRLVREGEGYVEAIARDITERKRAEQALQEALELFEFIVENAPGIAIQGFDRDGRVLHWNSASSSLYGIDAPEALRKPARELGLLDSAGEWEAGRSQVWSTGTPSEPRERLITKRDGTKRWVYSCFFPVKKRGLTAEVLCMDVDISRLKDLEAQLAQAQKLESVGRLAGGVAHDFNNLLTVINGYCALALGRLEPGQPQYDYMQHILKAGERAADLTRQLLAFSRKQVMQPRRLDLNQVVRESEAMLRRMIGEDIELMCLLEPLLPEIQADPGQVLQVLMNLAANARDAMPRGGKLMIQTASVYQDEIPQSGEESVAPGRYAALIISDTGEGMDAATRERIFEPFFTTKEQGKGTGLGLSTVYGIVRQSGGHIGVTSQPGHGSTFRIYFPVAG